MKMYKKHGISTGEIIKCEVVKQVKGTMVMSGY